MTSLILHDSELSITRTLRDDFTICGWSSLIIDQRFYRRKYNAEQALEEYAATERNETDIEALSGKLVEVVNQTMQPEKATLWLRKQ